LLWHAILHKFIFYLLYGYEGKTNFEEIEVRITKNSFYQLMLLKLNQYSLLDTRAVVQFHQVVCYLFAVVYVPYKVIGLTELFSHPIKHDILVRDLSAEICYPLVVRRHYLYRITHILNYVSTFSLITFVDRPIINRLEKRNKYNNLLTSKNFSY
jgi:hypothetical protein